ncbi:MAG: response regulator, partial [Deltaproteobacteria bacterium]|nr:response regulator [Deltaproteobacteria bacterium]
VGLQGVMSDLTALKTSEKEKKSLEEKLARSQKMKALGLLAGGVAHDLNNVLSGIVSYPDLLLMDLPEDSPLRKPLETIQDSGKKAAAIVQDLLTLARRGVTDTDVINLNDIVSDYLKSPEHETLKNHHPGADIEKDLLENLLNIRGSTVHMKTALMNLITNAAEALPHGGKITISTENRYVDRPIKGYDTVSEGDFVVLKVADNGTGIADDDLKRIFEPFYTKKVMGRSGTGLGMAVVWGTVQDHFGYIDIESTEGKGTTFELFFPVVREPVTGKKISIPLEDYMGSGKTILLVDDVKAQREIAADMLNRLGYAVTAVSSGEEAVEHLKKDSADLILLDMIMDPGIGGLETYRRILELNPGQKAIIASGFSETEQVKEALNLGAGAYIKKPYTLEKIGMAVKNELIKVKPK